MHGKRASAGGASLHQGESTLLVTACGLVCPARRLPYNTVGQRADASRGARVGPSPPEVALRRPFSGRPPDKRDSTRKEDTFFQINAKTITRQGQCGPRAAGKQ